MSERISAFKFDIGMMIRSVTVSDNLHLGGKCKIPYVPIIAIFITEFLVSSSYLCYGVYYALFVSYGYIDFHLGLWTPIIFVASWNIADPWSNTFCEFVDDSRKISFKAVICIGTVIFSISLILASKLQTCLQPLFYGFIGGLCSSLVTAQLRMSTEPYFSGYNKRFFETLIQIPRAISLLIQPFLILFLSDAYDVSNVQFIMAAFVLNSIPVCLLVEQKRVDISNNLAKYKTFSGLSIPLTDMNQVENPVHDSSSSDFEDSFDDEEGEEEENEAYDLENPIDNNLGYYDMYPGDSIHNYYRNIGVSILPEIPEENEDDLDIISSKRLSKISMKLEEINENSRRESILSMTINEEPSVFQKQTENHEGSKDNITQHTKSKESVNSRDLISVLKQVKGDEATTCFCFTPYKRYKCHKRLTRISEFLQEIFFKPFTRSASNIYFYLAVLSKAALSVASMIFLSLITFVPFQASINGTNFIAPNDQICLLSIIAFAWCFFLIGAPVIIKWSQMTTCMAFIVGLGICSVSLYVLTINMATEFVTLVCLLYGFGYGVVSYTEETVYRSNFGDIKWPKVKGTLQTISAVLVIIFYFLIFSFRLKTFVIFIIILSTYSIVAVMWAVTFATKYVFIVIYKQRRKNKDFLY